MCNEYRIYEIYEIVTFLLLSITLHCDQTKAHVSPARWMDCKGETLTKTDFNKFEKIKVFLHKGNLTSFTAIHGQWEQRQKCCIYICVECSRVKPALELPYSILYYIALLGIV